MIFFIVEGGPALFPYLSALPKAGPISNVVVVNGDSACIEKYNILHKSGDYPLNIINVEGCKNEALKLFLASDAKYLCISKSNFFFTGPIGRTEAAASLNNYFLDSVTHTKFQVQSAYRNTFDHRDVLGENLFVFFSKVPQDIAIYATREIVEKVGFFDTHIQDHEVLWQARAAVAQSYAPDRFYLLKQSYRYIKMNANLNLNPIKRDDKQEKLFTERMAEIRKGVDICIK